MIRRPDTTARVHLALANVDMVSITVTKALEDEASVDDVVVLLLDTRDEVARDLAVAVLQRSPDLDLDAEERRVLSRDQIPTGIAVVSVEAAAIVFAETHPSVSHGLRRCPPRDHVRVIAVADGGATLLHLPIRPTSAIGSA